MILTAAMLGLTVGSALVRRLLIIGGCVLALLIGCSRTYLGLHWPSDVLGGWLLATVMVSVTMALVNLALLPYPGLRRCPTCLIRTIDRRDANDAATGWRARD